MYPVLAATGPFEGSGLTLALLLVWLGGFATGFFLARPDARDFYRLFQRAQRQEAHPHPEKDARREGPRGERSPPRGRLARLAALPPADFAAYAGVAILGFALLGAIIGALLLPGKAGLGAIIAGAVGAANVGLFRLAAGKTAFR